MNYCGGGIAASADALALIMLGHNDVKLYDASLSEWAKDPALLRDWRCLQTSDHFYYMCVKYFADGDVHKYFSPYESPYDSYINFMNVLDNIRQRARSQEPRIIPMRRANAG